MRATRYLFSILLGMSFIGAQCGTPTGLTRTCSGSALATQYYKVAGSCGAAGTISVSVTSPGTCTLNVIESSAIGLPTSGAFASAAGASGYDLTKGNWTLNDQASGPMDIGTFLNCTAGPATPTGYITLSCEQEVCAPGDSDDVECSTGTSCSAHLTPTSADAGITTATPPDTGTGADAGDATDATTTADAH